MLHNLFQLEKNNTTVKTEFIAGITTFLTAGYIIFINPDILSASGMDKGALITVTALVAGIACFLVGLITNLPFMMAPGMGLNAFFTYSLCIGKGVPWETALGIVLVSGILFVVLTVAGIREKIINSIPASLRLATSVGIGLFIAFIGFKNMNLIVPSKATLVTLGSWDAVTLMGLSGLLITVAFMMLRVKGAILLGILSTTLIAVITGHVALPGNLVSLPPSPAPVAFQFDLVAALKITFIAPILTFMYVDLFDSVGTIIAISYEAKIVKKDGTIKNIARILGVDAIATVIGAMMGTSTTTTYIESASGIAEGGRTGLTAIVTGCLFILSMFLAPLIGIVPPYATGAALVVVGVLMMKQLNRIDFSTFETAVPAFMTLILMPLTYSISTGISFGFITYVVVKIMGGKIRDINVTLWVIAALSVLNLIMN